MARAPRLNFPDGFTTLLPEETVGLHYGGISCSAVGNIRGKVREGQLDIRSDLDPLASRIRTTHVGNTANAPKV
jgi:hypothetical protein